MNKFIIFTVAFSILVLIAGILLVKPKKQNTEGQKQEALEETSVHDHDQVKGSKDAALTLIEYSDFQCPTCARYHSFVNQAIEEFCSDIQIVFRHFPLRQSHPNAELAAQATEAAGKQGKFWKMHNLLFDLQTE